MEQTLLDEPESSERGPGGIDPELPAKTYFKRANSIPLLTEAEKAELIGRWQRFQDEKARNRVVEAHLRIPPAMARRVARRFGEPNKHVMTTDAVAAWQGHFALVEELTAEGNLALVECVDHFDPGKGFVFATYAGTCVRNAIWKRLRSFSSVVHRPQGKPTKTDIYIDRTLPDMQSPEDYCGGHARTETYGPNDERTSDYSERNEGEMLPRKYRRLRRPEPEPDYIAELDTLLSMLPAIEAKVISLRRHGLKLREVAEGLGVSTSTAWRLEQSAMGKLTWKWSQLNCQETQLGV